MKQTKLSEQAYEYYNLMDIYIANGIVPDIGFDLAVRDMMLELHGVDTNEGIVLNYNK